MADAVGNGGVDGVLGHVALDARVVVARAPAVRAGGLPPRCTFILCAVCQVRRMTSPTRPMAWLSLLIMLMAPRSCRMSSAAMVSLRMRLSAKARSSAMLASRWWHTMSMSTCSSSVLLRVGHGGVGGRWHQSCPRPPPQDVGRMPAARAFGVEGVDGAPPTAAMVFSTKPDSLSVWLWMATCVSVSSGHVQAVADGRGRGAPVFVQLQANGPGVDLLVQPSGRLALPLPRKPRFMGKASAACSMRSMLKGPTCRWWPACRWRAGAAAQHGGHAAGQGFFHLLGADEVDVAVDAACGDDVAFAADDLGAGADDDVHAGLRVGLPALPMAAMRPARRPMSALKMPVWSMTALVSTVSTAPCALVRWLCAMPSRMVLPPPNFTSSP